MADQGHEHRVFDVVIECIAVADTFEREFCRIGQEFRKSGVRCTEPAPRFHVKKRAKRLRDQLRYGDHPDHPLPGSIRPAKGQVLPAKLRDNQVRFGVRRPWKILCRLAAILWVAAPPRLTWIKGDLNVPGHSPPMATRRVVQISRRKAAPHTQTSRLPAAISSGRLACVQTG